FSLETNAPAGATINSTNGAFFWAPTPAQTPSTNLIAVRVTDNGSPNLSDAKSFTATVLPLTIKSITLSNDTVIISWRAVNARSYRVQYKDSLSAANWLDLSPDITATSVEATASYPIVSSVQRFYRL